MMNQDVGVIDLLGDMMEKAGFQDVSASTRKAPFSDWSDDTEMKQMAAVSPQIYEMDLSIAAARAIQPVLSVCSEQGEHVVSDALRDTRNKSIHAYKLRYVCLNHWDGSMN